ncbi:MAG: hypothetical protein H7645_02825 [Candidatus Heimdallarchaeota archaeon]|nr:hypothetical protein [Candidatus Heimdallarchaeota archaeon]MCK4769249.1 hypothetical protein [Candidatus Heimdallarchaeota archaeon]
MTKSAKSLKSLYTQFIQFEVDNHLFAKRINSIFFWERIRFTVFMKLFLTLVNVKEVDKERIKDETSRIVNYFLKFRNYLLSIFRFRKNPFLAKQHDLVLFSNSRRKKQDDGYWWDIYTDHLEKKLGYSTILLEKDLFFKYRKPVKTEKIVYHAYLDLLVDLRKYLRLSRMKLTDEDIIYLQNLSQKIKSKFTLEIDLIHIVYHNLTKRKRELPLYQKLLRKTKPKAAIVVCSYGKENFIEACKLNDIPVIELQHGVITKYHVGYSYEKETAKKHYFPDFLFTFGNYWKETVNYPIQKEKILNVGYPELEIRKQNYQNAKKKKQILFISQKTIGSLLSRFAVKLSQKEDLDYRIIYKLHPFEVLSWKENYPWLKQSKIEVVDHQRVNLYQLFAESEVLVGVYSTAIFEGLSFGLSTFLVDIVGIDYMEDLIQTGIATKISKPEELASFLARRKIKHFDTDLFFVNDSVKNIKEELDRIISKIK